MVELTWDGIYLGGTGLGDRYLNVIYQEPVSVLFKLKELTLATLTLRFDT